MGREHRWRALLRATAQHLAHLRRGKKRKRPAVNQNRRRSLLQHTARNAFRLGVGRIEARAYRKSAWVLRGKNSGNVQCGKRLHHQRRTKSLNQRLVALGGKHLRVSRAHKLRCAGRKACGTWIRRRAGNHHCLAARVLVRIFGRHRNKRGEIRSAFHGFMHLLRCCLTANRPKASALP